MEALTKAALAAVLFLLAATVAPAGDYDWDDIWAPYTQRVDRATATSGNAVETNSATQMITPWPPYVADRHIPGNGARSVGAMERYLDPRLRGGGVAAPTPPTSSGSPDTGDGGQTGNQSQGGSGGQGQANSQ